MDNPCCDGARRAPSIKRIFIQSSFYLRVAFSKLDHNMSSLQTILEAVSTLSNIQEADREGLLLKHREELKAALDSLHSLLQTPSTSIIESDSISRSSTQLQDTPDNRATPPATPPTLPSAMSPSAAPPSATPVHSVDPGSTNPPETMTELINLLEKRESEILECMRKDAQEVIRSQTDWTREDPRIVDISQITNQDRISPDLNLRSGFSALSLADEYTDFERMEGLESRVDKLCVNLNSGNRGSHYKKFVDHRGFKDSKKARKYVRYGIQLLVFMRIYSTCLEVNTKCLGIVGIVSFCFRSFMRIRFTDLPLLARLLASSKWKERAINKDSWMCTCFEIYNGTKFPP